MECWVFDLWLMGLGGDFIYRVVLLVERGEIWLGLLTLSVVFMGMRMVVCTFITFFCTVGRGSCGAESVSRV